MLIALTMRGGKVQFEEISTWGGTLLVFLLIPSNESHSNERQLRIKVCGLPFKALGVP